MQELRLTVPTYNASLFPREVAAGLIPEFGEPTYPVLIREAEGVRVILGSHDFGDTDKPDVQIERQPNGWVVFLHPVGGLDPCGYVYLFDDGRSYLLMERAFPPEMEMRVLDADAWPPEFYGRRNTNDL